MTKLDIAGVTPPGRDAGSAAIHGRPPAAAGIAKALIWVPVRLALPGLIIGCQADFPLDARHHRDVLALVPRKPPHPLSTDSIASLAASCMNSFRLASIGASFPKCLR